MCGGQGREGRKRTCVCDYIYEYMYGHTLHDDVLVNDGATYTTVIPQDYNGAEFPVRNRSMYGPGGIFFSLMGVKSVGFGNRFPLTQSTSVLSAQITF